MYSFFHRAKKTSGATLVFVVLGIVVVGTLTMTMTEISSTGNMEFIYTKPVRQAFYSAESGIRIVLGEYNALGTNDSPVDFLSGIHGKTFVLDQETGEQFTINIFSYGFEVVSHNASTRTITTRAVNKIPLNTMEDASSGTLLMPAGSSISIQDEAGNYVPVVLAADAVVTDGGLDADTVVFTYVPPVSGIPPDAAGQLDFVNFSHTTGTGIAVSGTTVRNLPAALATNFPRKNGRLFIYENGKQYTYRLLQEENNTVSLLGVMPESGTPDMVDVVDVADFTSKTLILNKAYAFQSIGTYGSNTLQGTNTVVYYDSPRETITELNPASASQQVTNIMNDTSAFNSNDISRTDALGNTVQTVSPEQFTSTQGSNSQNRYAAIYNLCDDPQTDPSPCEQTLRLDNEAFFRRRWRKDTRLSYEAQIKISSGWKLPYASIGLLFRFHEDENGDTNYYGVSFMKYIAPGQTLPDGVLGDHIPDAIKPPDKGTTITDWIAAPENWAGRPLPITEDPKLLLVFWRQQGARRDWIAYKDVTDDMGIEPHIDVWNGDGRIVSDNSTLLVRAEEQFVQGQKVNRIKVFYGDAAYDGNTATALPVGLVRAPDTLSYNIINAPDNGGRAVYRPQWDTPRSHQFPLWPSLSPENWEQDTDYFSWITRASAPYTVAGNPRPCTWDAINPAVNVAPLADANIQILSDGATIRSQEFLTPNSLTWPARRRDWPGNRPELAFHAAGRMTKDYGCYSFRGYIFCTHDKLESAAVIDDLAYHFLEYSNTP